MNLIVAWKQASSHAEITMTVSRGNLNFKIVVIKRGTFATAVQRLAGQVSDEELTSDRWQ